MLYREIIAVCSQIHTKHINTLCGYNVELLNFKAGITYSNHWDLNSYISCNAKVLRRGGVAPCINFQFAVNFADCSP